MIETPDPTELIAIADLKLKEGDFFRIRDLSNHKKVRYNNEEHQAYAFTAWHVLINEFKTKLKHYPTKKTLNYY